MKILNTAIAIIALVFGLILLLQPNLAEQKVEAEYKFMNNLSKIDYEIKLLGREKCQIMARKKLLKETYDRLPTEDEYIEAEKKCPLAAGVILDYPTEMALKSVIVPRDENGDYIGNADQVIVKRKEEQGIEEKEKAMYEKLEKINADYFEVKETVVDKKPEKVSVVEFDGLPEKLPEDHWVYKHFETDLYPWELMSCQHQQERGRNRGDKVSSAGARGAMQFMWNTWLEYSVDGNLDGKVEITNCMDSMASASNYMTKLIIAHNGDWQRALRAYNGGGQCVDGGCGESDRYSKSILECEKQLKLKNV